MTHERLVAEYGFDGHYQPVKMFVAEIRPLLRASSSCCLTTSAPLPYTRDPVQSLQ